MKANQHRDPEELRAETETKMMGPAIKLAGQIRETGPSFKVDIACYREAMFDAFQDTPLHRLIDAEEMLVAGLMTAIRLQQNPLKDATVRSRQTELRAACKAAGVAKGKATADIIVDAFTQAAIQAIHQKFGTQPTPKGTAASRT